MTFLAVVDPSTFAVPSLVTSDDDDFQTTIRLVVILDGSDKFREAHGADRWEQKERAFRALTQHSLAEQSAIRCEVLGGRYRDAEFATFVGDNALRRAFACSAALHRRLSNWNIECQLSWVDQLHARASVCASSWQQAVSLLQQAQRCDTVVDPEDWEQFSEEEQQLLREGLNLICGASAGEWNDVECQLTYGIDFSDDDSHVIRRKSKHRARFAELVEDRRNAAHG